MKSASTAFSSDEIGGRQRSLAEGDVPGDRSGGVDGSDQRDAGEAQHDHRDQRDEQDDAALPARNSEVSLTAMAVTIRCCRWRCSSGRSSRRSGAGNPSTSTASVDRDRSLACALCVEQSNKDGGVWPTSAGLSLRSGSSLRTTMPMRIARIRARFGPVQHDDAPDRPRGRHEIVRRVVETVAADVARGRAGPQDDAVAEAVDAVLRLHQHDVLRDRIGEPASENVRHAKLTVRHVVERAGRRADLAHVEEPRAVGGASGEVQMRDRRMRNADDPRRHDAEVISRHHRGQRG